MRMLRDGSETCELLKNRMRVLPEVQRSAIPPTICGSRGICHRPLSESGDAEP